MPSPCVAEAVIWCYRYAMTVADVCHVSSQAECYLAPALTEIAQIDEEAKTKEFRQQIVWHNVVIQILLHGGALYGFYLALTSAKWQTNLWMFIMLYYASTSITGGAHRMWTHKAFKANFWVRLFFMIGTTIAVQNDVIEWARDHRCHHKWSDSDADPHNIHRGFFFAHMGWLMVRKHPKVTEMGKKIDLSDLMADPILRFQRRYYVLLVPLCFLLLTFVPVFFWGEDVATAFYVAAVFRLAVQLHGTWFINSLSHMYGYKPFDTTITAIDNFLLASVTMGEAWHNFHHTFPQDYRTSEYMWRANTTAMFIDFLAWNGWVWDRKRMSKEAIERQKTKYGDHSRKLPAAHDY